MSLQDIENHLDNYIKHYNDLIDYLVNLNVDRDILTEKQFLYEEMKDTLYAFYPSNKRQDIKHIETLLKLTRNEDMFKSRLKELFSAIISQN